MLGRQPVIHRHDGGAQVAGEPAAQVVVLLRETDDVTASVNPQQGRTGLGAAGGAVQPNSDTGVQNQCLDVAVGPTTLERR